MGVLSINLFCFFLGLVINDCDENDAGEYTITIDNAKSSTAEVIVEPEEVKVKSPSPKTEVEAGFRKLLPNELKTNEDEDFTLECEVNNPSQITDWYLDDDLIEKNTPRFEIINEGPIRKLKGFLLTKKHHQICNLVFFSSKSRIK